MIPVILCGGSGTRLWPVSRSGLPKQLTPLVDGTPLDATLDRLAPLGPPRLVAVAGTEALIQRAATRHGLAPGSALFEPLGRNTAPAVALVCRVLAAEGRDDEVVGIFPADHLIGNVPVLLTALDLADRCAADGWVVTLGIAPAHPATGFGYIEVDAETVATAGAGALTARRVVRFREKPDAATARRFLAAGNFFWNAGIFVFRVAPMIASFRRLMPELWRALERLHPDLGNLPEVYAGIASESLDYGIMEHLDRLACIPCDPGWSDLGSWDEVARLRPSAPRVEVAAADTWVYPHGERTYAFVGVDDVLVVDTADATLVVGRGASQQVKEVVEELRRRGSPTVDEHRRRPRPWGEEEELPGGGLRRLLLAPDQRLTRRLDHRARWVVLQGQLRLPDEPSAAPLTSGDTAHRSAGRELVVESGDGGAEVLEIELEADRADP